MCTTTFMIVETVFQMCTFQTAQVGILIQSVKYISGNQLPVNVWCKVCNWVELHWVKKQVFS